MLQKGGPLLQSMCHHVLLSDIWDLFGQKHPKAQSLQSTMEGTIFWPDISATTCSPGSSTASTCPTNAAGPSSRCIERGDQMESMPTLVGQSMNLVCFGKGWVSLAEFIIVNLHYLGSYMLKVHSIFWPEDLCSRLGILWRQVSIQFVVMTVVLCCFIHLPSVVTFVQQAKLVASTQTTCRMTLIMVCTFCCEHACMPRIFKPYRYQSVSIIWYCTILQSEQDMKILEVCVSKGFKNWLKSTPKKAAPGERHFVWWGGSTCRRDSQRALRMGTAALAAVGCHRRHDATRSLWLLWLWLSDGWFTRECLFD